MGHVAWMHKPSKSRVAGDAFYCVANPADPAVEKTEDAAAFTDKVMFAWIALMKDPGCIEAHVFYGRHAKDPALRMAHLNRAVATGEKLWNPVAAEEGDDMTWWGFTATRPYIRLIQALGMEHLDAGNEPAARERFEKLLAMNPNDNQGIRNAMESLEVAPSPGM